MAQQQFDQTLRYAQDLASLRGTGRTLRRRIEENARIHMILNADDNPMMRALLSATPSPETYDILEAADGREALAMVTANHPTLAILDVLMPEMDGIEACRMIKADRWTKDTQIIILAVATEERERAVAAGADCFLTKPFSPMEQVVGGIERIASDPPQLARQARILASPAPVRSDSP